MIGFKCTCACTWGYTLVNITYRNTTQFKWLKSNRYEINYIKLTTHFSLHSSILDLYPTISLSCVSICLCVGFKTFLWAMNKSYSLPLTLWVSFFILFFYLLFLSTCHPWASRTPSMETCVNPARPCPWESCILPLPGFISNISLLGLFLRSFVWTLKELQVLTPCPPSSSERDLDNLVILHHTTMGSDTTWREITPWRVFNWVVNIS